MNETNKNENNKKENNINKNEEETLFEYEVKEKIGEGSFSKVKLGIHKQTKRKVAIKIISKNKLTNKDKIHLKREIKILNSLNHPNIIKIYEIKEDNNNFYLIMEFCSKGDLFKYISKKNKLNEEEGSIIFYQIINGLEYLHNNLISHRDLKLENILLDNKKNIKIIDYNLSNFFLESNNCLLKTPCGSPCYAAPEMIKNKTYNAKFIDIWSVGIILYVILCGFLPFEDKNNRRLYQKIINGKVFLPNFLSDVARNIIESLLQKNYNKRINIKQIKKHPFYIMGEHLYNNKSYVNNENNNILNDKLNKINNENNSILNDDVNIENNILNEENNDKNNNKNNINNNEKQNKKNYKIKIQKRNNEEGNLTERFSINKFSFLSDYAINSLSKGKTKNNIILRKITVNKKLFIPKEKTKKERESSLEFEKNDFLSEHVKNLKLQNKDIQNNCYSVINENKNSYIYSFEEEKNYSFNKKISKNIFLNNSLRYKNNYVLTPPKNNIRRSFMKKFYFENKISSAPKTQKTYLKIKKNISKNNKSNLPKKLIGGLTERNYINSNFHIK